MGVDARPGWRNAGVGRRGRWGTGKARGSQREQNRHRVHVWTVRPERASVSLYEACVYTSSALVLRALCLLDVEEAKRALAAAATAAAAEKERKRRKRAVGREEERDRRVRERERDVELVPGAYTIASPCRNNGAWMSHRVQSQSAIFRRGISQGNGRFVVLFLPVLSSIYERPPFVRPWVPIDPMAPCPCTLMRAFRINKSHARFNCPALFIRFSNDIFLSFSLSFRVKVFRVARQILGMKF